jgi:hypothetical protein
MNGSDVYWFTDTGTCFIQKIYQPVMSGMGVLSLLTVDHVDTEWQLSVMERVLFHLAITLSVLHYIVCTSLHCLYIITLSVHHTDNVMMYRQCNEVQTM